jgi:hypothetical protein
MPDGTWQAGKVGDKPPVESAIWRGYYQCAERILTMYADETGRESICRRLQREGWAFRNRQGNPVPVEVDAVRRVTANWPEYGGYISQKRARERHPVEHPPDEIITNLNAERAVFDLDLLARVARSRQKRALRKHPTDSSNRKARVIPLSGITYCAHCERLAQKHNNPRLRSRLWGRVGKYYRHKPGGGCGCDTTQVLRETYEADFVRLIKLLEIKPDKLEKMMLLAAEITPTAAEQEDLETRKAQAIALCQRRIQAAIDLYGERRIDRAEYLRRVERNEREIASWKARSSDREKLAMELTMCIHTVETMTRLWEVSSDEDKQGMARHLFEYVAYDLDRQEIVDFRLKPWADQFLVLRAGLYAEELYYSEDNNDRRLTPTGVGAAPVPSLNAAIHWLLDRLYKGIPLPETPVTDKHVSLSERNRYICARYAVGETLEDIARDLDLSHQRVHQIIQRWC